MCDIASHQWVMHLQEGYPVFDQIDGACAECRSTLNELDTEDFAWSGPHVAVNLRLHDDPIEDDLGEIGFTHRWVSVERGAAHLNDRLRATRLTSQIHNAWQGLEPHYVIGWLTSSIVGGARPDELIKSLPTVKRPYG